MEACTVITNIVLAIAALTGAVVAMIGLWAWRHELYGRADFELGA